MLRLRAPKIICHERRDGFAKRRIGHPKAL
jgi:hypothetical protein